MNGADYLIIGVLAFSMLLGLFRGFVRESIASARGPLQPSEELPTSSNVTQSIRDELAELTLALCNIPSETCSEAEIATVRVCEEGPVRVAEPASVLRA